MKKETLINWLTGFAIAVGVLQTSLLTAPFEPTTLKWVSAILILLGSIATVWKQTISNLIKNAARTPTIILGIIGAAGAVNEMFDVITLTNSTGQILRWILTTVITGLNIYSAAMFPTQAKLMLDEQKERERRLNQ